MTWSWAFGCVNCTWQEMAIVNGLGMLTVAVFFAGLYLMVRGYEKRNED